MRPIKILGEVLLECLQVLAYLFGTALSSRFPYININVGSRYLEFQTPGPNVMNKYWPMIVGDFAIKAAHEIFLSVDPMGDYTNTIVGKSDKSSIDGESNIKQFNYGTMRACEIALALGYKVQLVKIKSHRKVRNFKKPFC